MQQQAAVAAPAVAGLTTGGDSWRMRVRAIADDAMAFISGRARTSGAGAGAGS